MQTHRLGCFSPGGGVGDMTHPASCHTISARTAVSSSQPAAFNMNTPTHAQKVRRIFKVSVSLPGCRSRSLARPGEPFPRSHEPGSGIAELRAHMPEPALAGAGEAHKRVRNLAIA